MILDKQVIIDFTTRQIKGGRKILLADIRGVKIDTGLPGNLHMLQYLEQIQNLYNLPV